MQTSPEALAALDRGLAQARAALAPLPPLLVDQWADTYRVVPSQTSPATGLWQTSRYEVARGPMRWCTAPGTH